MRLIAETIPGLQNIYDTNPIKSKFTNLGDVISGLFNIAFYVALFAAFYFLVWGAFAYITAGGKKEELAKARSRITWAIVGLIIVLLAFSVGKYAGEILKPSGGRPF